jgi:hypothetical protein
MRFAHLKTHHGFERMRLRGSLARATNSISPLSCRTSKRRRSGPLDRHLSDGAHRLPEIAHDCVSQVHLKGDIDRVASIAVVAAYFSRIRTTRGRNANRKIDFFDSIDPYATFCELRHSLSRVVAP